jgi:hypothetical protein
MQSVGRLAVVLVDSNAGLKQSVQVCALGGCGVSVKRHNMYRSL